MSKPPQDAVNKHSPELLRLRKCARRLAMTGSGHEMLRLVDRLLDAKSTDCFRSDTVDLLIAGWCGRHQSSTRNIIKEALK